MRVEMPLEVRMASNRYSHVLKLQSEARFAGRVQLRKVVSVGLWDLVAIVDCETESDANLLRSVRDGTF